MSLKSKFSRLKRNKANTKLLMVELMRISSIDFTVEHMNFKLRKYGFGVMEKQSRGLMFELCEEGALIFNGYKPEKVGGRLVGFSCVFGLA